MGDEIKNGLAYNEEERDFLNALFEDVGTPLSKEEFEKIGVKPTDPDEDEDIYYVGYFKGGYLSWNYNAKTEESTVWLALQNNDEQIACVLPEGVGCKCNDGYKDEEFKELPHITTIEQFRDLYNLLNG